MDLIALELVEAANTIKFIVSAWSGAHTALRNLSQIAIICLGRRAVRLFIG